MHLTTNRKRYHAATILFSPAIARRLHNPAFGVGVSRPGREKRAPYTASDLAYVIAHTPCPVDAPTEAEWLDEFEARTMSAAEYRAFRQEMADASRERYARCDVAELAELRVSESSLAEALDADEFDRFSAYGCLPC